MFETQRLLARKRGPAAALALLVTLVAVAAAFWTAPASASNEPIFISFEKHWVGPGHYVGTTGDGGSIEMWVSNSTVTGNMQHFDVTISAAVASGSFTAVLDGTFNFSTARTLLNGNVTEGWLAGARMHEEGQLVSLDPLTFTGTLRLMPASG
ncbi:MAG TPA: hypothetical protein VE615_05970 [Gaiellaceae bacterium]|jgi:hypothetical protein|nr:hypothetical protein [Gaiellaceae bacterium]